MAGILRLSNTGTGNGQSTITSAASGDTTYTLPSGGGTFVTTASTQSLTVPFASGTAALPGLTPVGDPNTGIYSPGADQIALSTSGTGRLFVNSAGLIGIGTDAPDQDLVIEDSQNTGTPADNVGVTIRSVNRSTLLRLTSNPSFSNTIELGDTDATGAGAISYNNSNNNLFFTVNGSERLRITSTGFVGIETSAPGSLFTLGGSSPALEYDDSANAVNNRRWKFRCSGSSLILQAFTDAGSGGGNNFRFNRSNESIQSFQANTGGAGWFIVDNSTSRVGIGTTSPSYQLQLSTDSAGKPSTNTWTIVSDERIKEEIELADLDLCYEAVKNIPLKRFKWKDEVYTEEQAYDRRKLGWIAQDVETVFPKAVRQHEFKYNQVFEEIIIPAVPAELDDDGNIITEEQPERIEKGKLISEEVIEDCRDLNSDQIYAAMYGAIQKLISKVELLEAEVQALKG